MNGMHGMNGMNGMSGMNGMFADMKMGSELALMNAPHPVEPPQRPAKRRRLKGMDVPSLTKLLTALHQCLARLVDLGRGADQGVAFTEVPLLCLEEEFFRHWRIRFDARAMGEPNTATFLRRFPDVFHLRHGVQLMVAPAAAPNFDEAAEAGMEQPESNASGTGTEFAVACGEQVVALLANFVAEDRKSSGAPVSFQYASFELVQELFSKLRDSTNGDDSDQRQLLEAVLDPRPPSREDPPAPPPPRDPRGDFERDFRDFSGPPMGFDVDGKGKDRFDRDRWADRDRWNQDRRGPPGYRPDRRGSDGRSLCRQFQNGRCTYGDTCKFVHEMAPHGPY